MLRARLRRNRRVVAALHAACARRGRRVAQGWSVPDDRVPRHDRAQNRERGPLGARWPVYAECRSEHVAVGDDAALLLLPARRSPPVVQPPTAEAKPTALPESALKALLKQVNHHVNSRVRQRTDAEIYGVGELWRRSGDGKGAVGDCEDLAIEKRAELIDGGFPPDRLAFAVVYSRASGLHTVLVARTDVEDVVLDGRSPYVVVWTKAPYSWLSVQSMHDPMLWYAPDRAQTA
ncbi:transglutaminase-like cysteine peptidase [Sphingomonas sp. I4]